MYPARSAIGAGIALALTGLFTAWLLPEASALPFLVAPMGASAVLDFALPAAPLAQPRAVLLGNFVSALFGVAAVQLFPDPLVAGSLGAGAAILAMQLLRCTHPPGGAVALFTAFGGDAVREAGFAFALLPVGLNSLLLVGLGIAFNNLAGSRYPHRAENASTAAPRTNDQPAAERTSFSDSDVEAVLDRLEDRPDIEAEDLANLLRAVEAEAFARRNPLPLCFDIMSRDVITCHASDEISTTLALMDDRRVSALPVLDEQEHVVGLAPRHILARASQGAVREFMLSGACLVAIDRPAASLMSLLSDGVHHHAVVVWRNGMLAGLITQTDLLASIWHASEANCERAPEIE
tara:strand:+ start:16868 stop:17917 length:1050 start_codon:yes stop_codon:yes gene_type:complete